MSSLARWISSAVGRVREFAYKPPHARPQPWRPKIGLALGGGFARGIAHIGVLKVLEQERIPIHCLAGTSVGALIGAAYACGTPLAELERLAGATRFKDFGQWTLSWLGLATNFRLESFLARFCAVQKFEELKIPLAIAATDLRTGEPVYFTSGELGPALRASCAYPGLFLPVEHEGRLLVDGFVTAPVPVDALEAMGANRIIAVYLASAVSDGQPRSVADVIGRSFSIMQQHAHQAWRRKASVVIEPDVSGFAWDDFKKASELIATGEQAARAALPQLRALFQPTPRVEATQPSNA
jgi:NTE family protein